MSYYSIDLRFDVVRSLGFASISGTYAQIGSAIEHPTRIIIIQNQTDQDLMFSFYNPDDHIFLPTGDQLIIDVCTNRVTDSSGFFITVGTRFWVKDVGVAATSGAIYVSCARGRGD